MVEWDDLRYLVSLGRHGSTLAASRALGVDQSTVQRRIAALEKRVGRSLAARGPTGYRLTDLGQALHGPAQDVEAAVQRFEQAVAEAVRGTAGVVRVTCPEPIVLRLMRSGFVDRFHARHPGLRIEFVVSDRYIDLMRGDADIALRSGDTDDGDLVGRRIADSIWAIYGSLDYLASSGVLGPIPALRRIWRVLTPPRLRHEPRVAAFFDFVVAEADALTPILTC